MDFLVQSRRRDFETETEKLTPVSEDLFISVPNTGFCAYAVHSSNPPSKHSLLSSSKW